MKRVFYALALAVLLVSAPLSAQALQVSPAGWEDKVTPFDFFRAAGAAPKMIGSTDTPVFGGGKAEFTLIGGLSIDRTVLGGFDSDNPSHLGMTKELTWAELIFTVYYQGGSSLVGNFPDNSYLASDNQPRMEWIKLGADYRYIAEGIDIMLGKGTFIFGFEDASMGNDFDYNDMIFAVNVQPVVPIPGAVWLMGSGLAGLFALRRKTRA